MAKKTLYLLDGSSLAYRSYYALLRGGGKGSDRPSGLSTSAGLPTGAVYGFLTTLRKILNEEAVDYLAVTFDEGAPSVRLSAYPEYKANRKPMPEDLRLQWPYLRRAVDALSIPILTCAGHEADDVLGTLARRAARAGFDVVIVTMDKDMYQLLGPRVAMLQVRTETKRLLAADVEREFGVPPERVADVLALWGDPSDNIPGVKGIGEKGAKELVSRLGGLDQIYAGLDSIKPVLAARLRAGERDARLSKQLATIATDLPLVVDLESLIRKAADRDALEALCRELEFKALAEELSPIAPAPSAERPVLSDQASLLALLAESGKSGVLAIEALTEAATAPAPGADLLGLGLSPGASRSAYLALSPARPGLPAETALRLLQAALLDPAIEKVGADLKGVGVRLGRSGLSLGPDLGDVRLLSYLLDPGRPSHEIEDLAPAILRQRAPAPLAPVRGRAASRTADLPIEDAARFAANRADLALALKERLWTEVEKGGLSGLYRDVERPLLLVLAGMELAGIRLDAPYLAAMSSELAARLDDLTRRIHAAAGGEFNIHSPRQLGEILFEKMNLPVLKKTRKSRAASTDLDVLEELAGSYELPRLVLEHREVAKLKGTYVDALPLLVDPSTGRLHTTFHQTVAATGRLSSADPNLQNIPIRTELGRRIRKAFVAAEGHCLVIADYSQVELRLAAHLSQDPELVQAFKDGADVHRRTAARVFGVAESLVTPELRRRAKVINFGILYGMSAFGLAKELGLAPREAQALIGQYFDRYRGVRAWLDRTIAETRERGHVKTLLGRVRHIPEIRSPTRSVREYAERMAVNTPLQGTAADLIKLAMVRIAARLAERGLAARLLLQVHDELVIESALADAQAVAALVKSEMEGVHPLTVPLEVSIGSGPSWLEAK